MEGGRPPRRPRLSRFLAWSAGSGIAALSLRRRRCARIAALDYILSPSTRPGLVRGRPGHRRAIFSPPISGARPGNRGAARHWSPAIAADTRNRPAGGSCWSARPWTGPAPPGPVTRPRTGDAAGRSARPAPVAPGPHRRAGRARRAPAACWCARTTVASAATVHARPSASSHPARSRSRIISQAPSPDQRRCRLSPSSNSRKAPAGRATGTRSGSGRRSRRSPAGDHSTGAPAADEQAVTAPAAPIPHQSGHDALTGPHPRVPSTPKQESTSTGQALTGPHRLLANGPYRSPIAGEVPRSIALGHRVAA